MGTGPESKDKSHLFDNPVTHRVTRVTLHKSYCTSIPATVYRKTSNGTVHCGIVLGLKGSFRFWSIADSGSLGWGCLTCIIDKPPSELS